MTFIGRRKGYRSLAAFIFCAILIGTAYWRGISRGLDHTFNMTSEPYAYTIAISDLAYNLNLGYVGYSFIYSKIFTAFMRPGHAHDEAMYALTRDGDFVNETLQAVSVLSKPAGPVHFDTGGLLSMYYNDLGFVDLIKMSFRTFGIKIEAMYRMHYLIVLIGVAALIAAFPGNILAMATAIMLSYGFFAQINSDIFSLYFPTVFGMRGSSVLAMAPALHLALLLAWRTRMTPGAVLLALVQASILVFTIHVRTAAMWAMIGLGLMTLIYFVSALRAKLPVSPDRRLAVFDSLQVAVRWPFVLVVGVYLAHGMWVQSKMHAVYDTDDVMSRHGFWHNAYMDLAAFDPEALALSGMTSGGDDMGWAAATRYADRVGLFHNVTSYYSGITHTPIRQSLDEKLMRRVCTEYFFQHPMRVLNALLIDKPPRVVRGYIREIFATYPSWVFVGGVGLSVAFAFALRRMRWSGQDASAMLLALACLVIGSTAPFLIIEADRPYLTDSFFLWPTALCLSVPLIAMIADRKRRRADCADAPPPIASGG